MECGTKAIILLRSIVPVYSDPYTGSFHHLQKRFVKMGWTNNSNLLLARASQSLMMNIVSSASQQSQHFIPQDFYFFAGFRKGPWTVNNLVNFWVVLCFASSQSPLVVVLLLEWLLSCDVFSESISWNGIQPYPDLSSDRIFRDPKDWCWTSKNSFSSYFGQYISPKGTW